MHAHASTRTRNTHRTADVNRARKTADAGVGDTKRKGYICNCKSIKRYLAAGYHPMPPAPLKNISRDVPRGFVRQPRVIYLAYARTFSGARASDRPARYLVAYLFLHR